MRATAIPALSGGYAHARQETMIHAVVLKHRQWHRQTDWSADTHTDRQTYKNVRTLSSIDIVIPLLGYWKSCISIIAWSTLILWWLPSSAAATAGAETRCQLISARDMTTRRSSIRSLNTRRSYSRLKNASANAATSIVHKTGDDVLRDLLPVLLSQVWQTKSIISLHRQDFHLQRPLPGFPVVSDILLFSASCCFSLFFSLLFIHSFIHSFIPLLFALSFAQSLAWYNILDIYVYIYTCIL